jgi:hypothetical protein
MCSNPTTVTFQVLLPSIDLLDDANNDGLIDADDEPVKDTAPGAIILANNGSLSGSVSEDVDYIAQENITIDSAHLFGSASADYEPLPYDLSGWSLTLKATNGDGTVQIFDTSMSEIDGDSTGTVSWDLGSGWSDVPTNVYVAAANPQQIEMQLAYVAPSAPATPTSPPPKDQGVITAKDGELIAPQIQDNKATQPLPRALQDSQGAFVPLNDEDDAYALTTGNQLIADTAQTGAIANDAFLMPVVIKGTVGVNYNLLIPNNIRIWQQPNRTDEVLGMPLTVAANGYLKLYVEGISVGSGIVDLQADDGGGEYGSADQLKITVFEIDGAQNVPGSSTDGYSAKGAMLGASNSGFLPQQTTGGAMSPPINGNGGGSANVKWNNVAEVGHVAYQPAPDYLWEYAVNVVQISITDPTLATPGTVGQSTNPLTGALLPTVSSTTAFPFAMSAGANLAMLAPVVTYAGVAQNRGINFMDVGYIQNSTSRTTNAVVRRGRDANQHGPENRWDVAG